MVNPRIQHLVKSGQIWSGGLQSVQNGLFPVQNPGICTYARANGVPEGPKMPYFDPKKGSFLGLAVGTLKRLSGHIRGPAMSQIGVISGRAGGIGTYGTNKTFARARDRTIY